jgi:hypothetical protein
MSKVQLAGNASGTGIFTIASPNSNTDRTLTLPDSTGTLLNSASTIIQNGGPAFSAFSPSGAFQSITNTVSTKIVFANENFDTAGCFNNTGSTVTLNGISTPSYSFAPNVAGYYQISAYTNNTTNSTGIYLNLSIFKNGSAYPPFGQMGYGLASVNSYAGAGGAILIYMNGTSDYLQLNVLSNVDTSLYQSYFNGFLARAA